MDPDWLWTGSGSWWVTRGHKLVLNADEMSRLAVPNIVDTLMLPSHLTEAKISSNQSRSIPSTNVIALSFLRGEIGGEEEFPHLQWNDSYVKKQTWSGHKAKQAKVTQKVATLKVRQTIVKARIMLGPSKKAHFSGWQQEEGGGKQKKT